MKTLREQLEEIGCSWIGPEWVRAVGFPGMVNRLAIIAFRDGLGDTVVTRAIRRGVNLMERPGFVTADEPAVD